MASSTQIQADQEIRFAVVMYGGVSLAIYMNGIAQELLHMVRATAPRGKTTDALVDQPKGTEAVYREIGQILYYGRNAKEARAQRDNKTRQGETKGRGEVRTRFVIDVISGTSAGGINGIFLAKALVNNQELKNLKDLWVSEGDLSKLLNDDASVRDIRPLPPSVPPKSLLNSRRMYWKLVDAFRQMSEQEGRQAHHEPLVDELDLVVTTTDVRGARVKLRLLDDAVTERRHRNVFKFHFRRDTQSKAKGWLKDWQENPFRDAFNPLLAFASRCTSAFPFAFEPMTLDQANEVLVDFPARGEHSLSVELLEHALGENVYRQISARTGSSNPASRAFADGGYLDNKPFSHAIDALTDRRAKRPVNRRLLYIEPSPELMSITAEGTRQAPPDALDNVRAALLGVPRYETIREDLQRVLERNRSVRTLNQILDGLDVDFTVANKKLELPRTDYGDHDLTEHVERHGVGYGGYHRLKVDVLTDKLALKVAGATKVDPASDHLVAISSILKAWRMARFADYVSGGASAAGGKALLPTTSFLLQYDVDYRLRRLDFLLDRVDQVARRDPVVMNSMTQFGYTATSEASLSASCRELRDKLEFIRTNLMNSADQELPPEAIESLNRAIKPEHLTALLECFTENERLATAEVLLGLRAAEPSAERDTEVDPKVRSNWIETISECQKANILVPRPNAADERVLRDLFKNDNTILNTEIEQFIAARKRLGEVDEAAAAVSEVVSKVTNPASAQCKALFEEQKEDPPSMVALRKLLERDFKRFEDYDHVIYPTLFAAGIGEERVPIDVLRVSPIDAKALSGKANRLAGFSLHHFGAFLDPQWRRHDITWGRFDGAERIITALLPDPADADLRDQLIKKAIDAIIEDQLKGEDQDAVIRALTGLVESDRRALARRWVNFVSPTYDPARVLSVLRSTWENDALYRFVKSGNYSYGPLDRPQMLKLASRGSLIIGEMLNDIGTRFGATAPTSWLTRITRVFWGIIEVAIPNSVMSAFAVHLLNIFMLFSLLVAAVGFAFNRPEVRTLGIVWFSFGFVFTLLRIAIQQAIYGRKVWTFMKLSAAVTASVVAVLAGWAITLGMPILLAELGFQRPIETVTTGLYIALAVTGIAIGVNYGIRIVDTVARSPRNAANYAGRFARWLLSIPERVRYIIRLVTGQIPPST